MMDQILIFHGEVPVGDPDLFLEQCSLSQSKADINLKPECNVIYNTVNRRAAHNEKENPYIKAWASCY